MRAAETVEAMRAAAMDEDVHAVVVLLVVTLVVWWRDACAMWIGSMDWMCDVHVHERDSLLTAFCRICILLVRSDPPGVGHRNGESVRFFDGIRVPCDIGDQLQALNQVW